MNYSKYTKAITKVGLDLSVLSLAFYLAFVCRFEGSLPQQYKELLLYVLPAVLCIKILCFTAFGVQRLTWRYVSLKETQRIFLSLMSATFLLLAWRLMPPSIVSTSLAAGTAIPLSVIVIDLLLAFLGAMALRVAIRAGLERSARSSPRGQTASKGASNLIIGTGRTGALVAREVAEGRAVGISAAAMVTETRHHVGQKIHGLPVVGAIEDLDEVLDACDASQALIALDNANGRDIRRIVTICKKHNIPAKIIPKIPDIVGGRINISTVQDVTIEDLLRRRPVALDVNAIAKVVRNKVVLVSGAGGSIGSELCRWICRYQPTRLILVEQAENSLFHIHQELLRTFPGVSLVPCIADICDAERLREIFAACRPAVVFHAAAHKHVPLMECNPGEAVKNNVMGTKNLADIADEALVEKFVMISTDKAINPTSVMGVSKRVAEMYVQALNERSRTGFVAVRFGNVLGSNGSVVPIFKEQIARGGPVTVTHPEMRRYFMTIPEACQLVMQAASMGEGGEIFILDMGEQVKILDLARDLIRLSGLVPDEDIEIRYSGVRPGEKLYEELCLEEENANTTRHPQIFIGQLRAEAWEDVDRWVRELVVVAEEADGKTIRQKFKEIVPEYRASDLTPIGGKLTTPQPIVAHVTKLETALS
jgi:FlaA1/EpsC-like NDP-sugar epimerase